MGKANGKAQEQERTFTVDMSWTDLNDVEIGFFIHSRHRAKSREFTQDSDVIGEVLEGGQRTGLISYREGLWKSEIRAKSVRAQAFHAIHELARQHGYADRAQPPAFGRGRRISR